MVVLDWTQIVEEHLDPLTVRQVVSTDTMTVVRRKLMRGAKLRPHRHAEEQITMVESGTLRFVIEGVKHFVSAGQMIVVGADLRHSIEAIEDSVSTDVFPLLPE